MKEEQMTETERLIQRFVDQELTGEERVALLVRLAREQSLREELLDLEQLMVSVGRLPRPTVPDRFVAQVLDRIAPAPSVWERLTSSFWRPHTLRWNFAGALAAAVAVLVIVGGVIARRSTGPLTPADPAAAIASSAAPPVLVRLVVLKPDARTVDVAGDFNGWDPTRTPLEQTATGAWTVTIPLQPGRYEYMFVVDGMQWVVDPFAVEQTDDGFGSRNAVLDVRPPTEASL